MEGVFEGTREGRMGMEPTECCVMREAERPEKEEERDKGWEGTEQATNIPRLFFFLFFASRTHQLSILIVALRPRPER